MGGGGNEMFSGVRPGAPPPIPMTQLWTFDASLPEVCKSKFGDIVSRCVRIECDGARWRSGRRLVLTKKVIGLMQVNECSG